MASIKLPPDAKARLQQALKDLEEMDEALDALESIGQLHPGQREAHEANRKALEVLLAKF
jgi:ABC-type phosphate/phosphonate transport system substrate-binding protein